MGYKITVVGGNEFGKNVRTSFCKSYIIRRGVTMAHYKWGKNENTSAGRTSSTSSEPEAAHHAPLSTIPLYWTEISFLSTRLLRDSTTNLIHENLQPTTQESLQLKRGVKQPSNKIHDKKVIKLKCDEGR